MKSSGGFEVHCCSFFVEIRTPVRRVLPVAGASSGAGFSRWQGRGLLHRQISVFYAGGEYDLCFGAAELLEFVDEVVQFHGGAEGYFDEHGVIAGDAVAFDDVWDGLDEGIEVFFLVGFYFQVDECFYMITEKYRVDLGVVACDQPVFFEVFDPGGDSGGGKEDFLCDFLYRGAGVFLKHFDDLSVDVVEFVFHVECLLSMKKCYL